VKAAGRNRIIQIPPALRSILLGMKARPRYTNPGDPVFVSSTGRPLDQHGYLRTLKRAGAKVGMPWISWRVFRNTHATLTKIVGREIA
jgi:integrase